MATAPFPFVYSGPPASPYPPPAVFPAPPFRYSNFTSAAAPPTQPFGSFPHGATYPYPTPASAYMPDHHPVQAAPQIDAYPSPFSPGGSSTFPYDATCYCPTCVAPQIPTHVGPNQLPTAPTPIRSEPEEYGSAAARYDPLLSSSPHAARDATGALSGPLLDCIPDDVFDGTHEKKLIHKHKATGILSMASSDSNHRSVTQQAPTQSSFDSLQAAMSKLSALVPQLALSMGIQTTEAPAADSPPRAVTAPSTSSASSAAASSSAPTHGALQVFTEMPQQYGLNNLSRQSIFLADGSEHSYFTLPSDYPLELATPPVSHSAVVNVGVDAPLSVAAQLACLAPGLSTNANTTADSESTFIYGQQPMIVQDASNVFKEMPVYDVYEEDATASQSCVHPTLDIIEAVTEQVEVKADSDNPIICPEKPTDGVYSSANENKYENKIHTVCFNNASDSEEATYLKFSHAPVVHSDGSIKLTTENSTQATSTLCVHEAIVYCHDERPEHINCTNGLEPVQLKFEQEDILIGGAVSNIVYSTAWELVAPPSHSINHAKLRLLWDPGTSASLHSSKGNLCNQVDTYGISTDFRFTISEDMVAIDCYSRPTNTCFSAVTIVHLLLHYSKGNRVGNRETLPWYPVIRTPSSIYFCLRGLIATSVVGKQLSWLQISEPATWQSQVTSASYAWDPGVKIFLCSWLNILTVWSETDKSLSCTNIPDLAAWRNQSVGIGSGTCYIWDLDTMDLLDQLELLHQQGIQKNYKARNLLTAPTYLQIVEMNILFITFLPP